MRRCIWAAAAVWGSLSVAGLSGCGDEVTAPPSTALSIQFAPTDNGDVQTGIVGATLAKPLRVLVRRGTTPAPGVAVYWNGQGHVSADSAWSPDGTRIAFGSYRDGDAEIYVMNAGGSGLVRLTNNVGLDQDPTWSSDGTRIAFASNRDGNYEIYVMNADSSGSSE